MLLSRQQLQCAQQPLPSSLRLQAQLSHAHAAVGANCGALARRGRRRLAVAAAPPGQQQQQQMNPHHQQQQQHHQQQQQQQQQLHQQVAGEQCHWHDWYASLLARGRSTSGGRAAGPPALLLAPMENLMDRPARLSLKDACAAHGIGAFDEACTEFIRVPARSDNPRATTRGITAGYDATELGGVPLAAQLMGSNTELLALAAARLVQRGAPRIDLNCGCPANVVTGGGAGSSLLKEPQQLQRVVAALVRAVGGSVPVSVKMRSGFLDASLFEDNLLAVQEAGAAFVTIHPRTKAQSYNGRADWGLIARAKQLLTIPVVGNGDVVSVGSALSLLRQTGCDGLMVGRGCLQDPLLFHRIRRHFAAQHGGCSSSSSSSSSLGSAAAAAAAGQAPPAPPGAPCEAAVVADFLRRYASYGFDGRINGAQTLSASGRLGRLKKVMKYVFCGQPQLRDAASRLLRAQPGDVTPEALLEAMAQQVHLHWAEGGPREEVLVNHVAIAGLSKAAQTWLPGRGEASSPGASL